MSFDDLDRACQRRVDNCRPLGSRELADLLFRARDIRETQDLLGRATWTNLVEQRADAWNERNPAGSLVYVTRDDGATVGTTTRSAAWVNGALRAVVMVAGRLDAVPLARVEALPVWTAADRELVRGAIEEGRRLLAPKGRAA